MELPHISTKVDTDGRLLVTVDDWELFDYVDDYLTEEHDFTRLELTFNAGNPKTYTMAFPSEMTLRVERALSLLDAGEIRRIYLLNNPETE